MPRTVTIRVDDKLYQMFRRLAQEDHRPLSNWLVVTTLHHLEECQLANAQEMAGIRGDRDLVRRLRSGSRDARLRRGRFAS